VLHWDAQLKEVSQQIAELEDRISAHKKEIEDAQWATNVARGQRILAFREQHLERLKFHAQFIEQKIAQGHRDVKPIPYSKFALICFDAAKRLARGDAAEKLREIGSTFATKRFEARVANGEPRPAAQGPARRQLTHYTEPVSSSATLSGERARQSESFGLVNSSGRPHSTARPVLARLSDWYPAISPILALSAFVTRCYFARLPAKLTGTLVYHATLARCARSCSLTMIAG
jgi:hypothetical protein